MGTPAPDARVLARNIHSTTWAMAQGDVGGPLELPGYPDKTLCIAGTYGAGATFTLQGSSDGINWATLNDSFANPISFTSGTKIVTVMEDPRYIRPNLSGGDGTTSLTVNILSRRSAR